MWLCSWPWRWERPPRWGRRRRRARAPCRGLTKALKSRWLSLGHTAALVVDLRTGEVVFQHNGSKPVAPASNEKLPVSWAALKRLGAAYRFHTELYGAGVRRGAVWEGDLVLKGFGDPTLASSDLDGLARRVRAAGIRSVTGRVLGDESYFDRRRAASGWKTYFLGGETPPLSGLVVDRARGWPALSPPLLAARSLRDALVRAGVAVAGRPGLGIAPPDAASLASDVSVPLAEIVRVMNHESDNFYAEMLLKGIAAAAGKPGSSSLGGKLVVATMAEAGIPVQGVQIVDGSGLSRLDRLTASALVGVLQAGLADPSIRSAFVGSLAVAGRSGTLELAPARSARAREGQDRHHEPGLHAVRLHRPRLRVRRAAERQPGLVVGGTGGTGPVRDAARRHALTGVAAAHCPSSARRPASSRIGTPSFSAFAALEPGLSPTITAVVFFETESATLAPSASRAAFAASRV